MQDRQEKAAQADIIVEKLDSTLTHTEQVQAAEEIAEHKAQLIYNNSRDPSDRFRIVGTQMDTAQTAMVPGTMGCFASYNANLIPYSATCQ